jgi:hypothetical protein
MRYVETEGTRFLWRDILRLRREQRTTWRKRSSLLFFFSKRTAAQGASAPLPGATGSRRCLLNDPLWRRPL